MSTDETDSLDPTLLGRASAGDESAFTLLFHQYYDRIRTYAFRLVLDAAAADDVTQEVFLRVAKSLHSLQDSSFFTAWIYRIASNAARDHLRARRSYQRKLEGAAAEGRLDFGKPSSKEDEQAENALAAVRALPIKQREAVVLVFFEDCSHAEAARRLGCAVSTISWRIFLAKRTLRKILS